MQVLSIFGALMVGVLLAGYAAAFLLVFVLRALTALVVSSPGTPATHRHRPPVLRLPALRRERPTAEPRLRTT